MILIKFFVVSLCMGACITSAFSQGDVKTEGKHPQLRVSCLGKWKKHDLYIKLPKKGSKKKMHKIEILDMGYSPTLKYKVGQPVQFYKKTEDTEAPYEVFLTIEVPSKYKKPLILLIPLKNKTSYRVFDVDSKAFPFGSFRLVNFTNQNFLVAMDKNVKSLKSNKVVTFSPAKQNRVRAGLRIVKAKTKKSVFSTMMIRRKNKRLIVFLGNTKDESGQERLETRMLVDFDQSAP